MELAATMEIAWLAVDKKLSPVPECSIVLRDYGIHQDVGYVDIGYFAERKGQGLPHQIWFNSDFLAFLAGENNCANIIDDEGNMAPVGSCHWQYFYDPPPSQWPVKEGDPFKELVKANYQGRQYVWEIVGGCECGCHTKGEWRD